MGGTARRAGHKAKTYKTFLAEGFRTWLFAGAGYQPSRAEPTPHTRGVAVGGAALTLGLVRATIFFFQINNVLRHGSQHCRAGSGGLRVHARHYLIPTPRPKRLPPYVLAY